jgi:hypothetical protein
LDGVTLAYMRTTTGILFIILSLILTGCSAPETIVIVDPFWKALIDVPEDDWFTSIINQLPSREPVEWIEIENRLDAYSEINGIIANKSPITVVMGPLFLEETIELAQTFPEIDFFSLEAGPEEETDNVYSVVFNREDAFADAGTEAGEYINNYFQETGNESRCAVLYFRSTDERSREMESFRQGFIGIADESNLILKSKRVTTNREDLRKDISEMLVQDVKLFVFALSKLNPFCLEFIADKQVKVITEGWSSSGIITESVLFSIESDIMDAIDLIVGHNYTNEDKIIVLQASLVDNISN